MPDLARYAEQELAKGRRLVVSGPRAAWESVWGRTAVTPGMARALIDGGHVRPEAPGVYGPVPEAPPPPPEPEPERDLAGLLIPRGRVSFRDLARASGRTVGRVKNWGHEADLTPYSGVVEHVVGPPKEDGTRATRRRTKRLGYVVDDALRRWLEHLGFQITHNPNDND